ncbi:TPA: translation initiation factor IF-3 [Candidatus Bipolaricaulota bacterium]|nr:translation initiation factor IF-3 [Candidatus Bipolaricaulota bacterium]HIQ00254.1 translation initiation factor IF-3 [Candidatus Bipolaricaulota bacterium]
MRKGVGRIKRQFRINEQIRAREVLLIDADGRNLGVTPLGRALELAQERGLDLVEVAPEANPVVCKIVDYGKYRYQLEKREKKQRRPSRLKEVKFTIQTGEHDFQTKLSRIRGFLEDGDKVRVTIFFKGRQIIHIGKGQELLQRVAEATQDIAKVDQDPTPKGRTLQMLLTPLPRKGGRNEEKNA